MGDARHLRLTQGHVIRQARARASTFTLDHGLPLLIFGAITAVLTWPLAARLGDRFPAAPGEGAQDLWQNLWNIWWVGEALGRGANPFYTDALFYPRGASLLFHPLNLTSALMALPLRALFGPVAAYNLVVLLSFVLSGYAVFLLARAHGCGRAASLAGGLAYTASAFHFFHLRLGHLEQISMQWLPLYALALDGLLRRTEERVSSIVRVLLAALALLAVVFTSLYAALYSALLTGLWIMWYLVKAWRGRGGRTTLATSAGAHEAGAEIRAALLRLAAMLLLTLLVVGPTLLLPMAHEARAASYMLPALEATVRGSAAPADAILPPDTHPLRRILALPQPVKASLFLGYLPLALAACGAVARPRRAGRWLALGLLAWLLALGPALPPYRLLYALPLLQAGRYPDRFALLALLAVGLLAALGADVLLAKLQIADCRLKIAHRASRITVRRSAVAAGLLALILLELYPGATPLTPPPDNPFYHSLARDAGRFSIFEMPINRANGAWLAMYDQTIHHHPILDGALARPAPRIPFEWLPLMRALEHPDAPVDIIVQPLEQRAAALRFFNLRYLIYHREDENGPVVPPTAEALSRVAGVPVRQVYADEGLVAYRIDVPGGPPALPAVATIGEGWYDLETPEPQAHRWITAGGGAVQLYAPQDQPVTLRLKLLAYREPRSLEITLDGQPIGQVVAQPWLTELRTPPFRMTEGPHTLRLAPSGPGIAPRAAGEGADDRPLTVAVFELEVEGVEL
jgi:hypothetical protein